MWYSKMIMSGNGDQKGYEQEKDRSQEVRDAKREEESSPRECPLLVSLNLITSFR